ncbi:hypothetical protein cyc_08729 [Cyclospora cayetanensis]|uniref:Uncharacterized protein n=1 Tax=Cyclospora cayetanensis TaxID=88456 RepID=A0A1D3D1U0_9EIME|nr:hypothetical protein cyc_08729 [Cyclospora cayetanensis]
MITQRSLLIALFGKGGKGEGRRRDAARAGACLVLACPSVLLQVGGNLPSRLVGRRVEAPNKAPNTHNLREELQFHSKQGACHHLQPRHPVCPLARRTSPGRQLPRGCPARIVPAKRNENDFAIYSI